jgi:hypothetical protein
MKQDLLAPSAELKKSLLTERKKPFSIVISTAYKLTALGEKVI